MQCLLWAWQGATCALFVSGQEEQCPWGLPSNLPLPHSTGVVGWGSGEQFAISFLSPVTDTELSRQLYPTLMVEAVSPLLEEEEGEGESTLTSHHLVLLFPE